MIQYDKQMSNEWGYRVHDALLQPALSTRWLWKALIAADQTK